MRFLYEDDGDMQRALLYAIEKGNFCKVMLLLDQGVVDINASNIMGVTPLLQAIYARHLNIVELLLDRGADLHRRNPVGGTVLMSAVQTNHRDIVELLLNRGSEINARNLDLQTPLMIAVRHNAFNVVSLLVERGSDLHARDNEGRTPLMIAIGGSRVSVVQYLIEEGSSINAMNHHGRTPLSIAMINRVTYIEYLIEQGAKFEGINIINLPDTGSSDFSNEIAQGHLHAAKERYDADAMVLNQPNRFGQTPLMRAVICAELDAVNWLIEHHADVDAVSEDGSTALYFAAREFMASRHENEALAARKLTIMQIIYANCNEVDHKTAALMARDTTDVLRDNMFYHDFVLK